jgi:5'-3' exonuclease|tara:strand:+ start:93 stop:815 length:723 start_codon:yes stop_codon:yes gene_type:complete
MKVLIDGDILVYRTCFVKADGSQELSLKQALYRFDNMLDNMLLFDLPDIFEWQIYLTGSNNFRVKKAVTAPYKGNRKSEKPAFYSEVREHIIKEHGGLLINDMEADDMLAIDHYILTDKLNNLEGAIIATIDKDLDQVEGWHYNFVTKDRYFLTEEEARLNFYMQFLVGDRVDNIIGKRGIGKVKADKLLNGLKEEEQWKIIVEELGIERAVENGHLLYMLRTVDDDFSSFLKQKGLQYD